MAFLLEQIAIHYSIPFVLAAIIAFEEASYTTSEMFGGQEVCVAVANGNVLTDLVVHIDLLPSTATGESQTLLLPPYES